MPQWGDALSFVSSQSRTLKVRAGLFVLRYQRSRAAPGSYPVVRVDRPEDGSAEFVLPPAMSDPMLLAPGDGFVILAHSDTQLDIKVSSSHDKGSLDAELTLEPVSNLDGRSPPVFVRQDPAPRTAFKTAKAPAAPLPRLLPTMAGPGARAAAVAGPDLSVLAHVARRGDMVVRAGEWICGPDLPMAIEGLEVRWPNAPDGVDVRVAVAVRDQGAAALAPASLGQFAGTRGRAAPIVKVELSLVGPGAERMAIAAEALFLGASVQDMQGRHISFSGPTGREPLVGFKLSILRQEEDRHVAADPHQSAGAAPSGATSGKVRVFRSSQPRTNGSRGALGA
jgi:hypothetical protein